MENEIILIEGKISDGKTYKGFEMLKENIFKKKGIVNTRMESVIK